MNFQSNHSKIIAPNGFPYFCKNSDKINNHHISLLADIHIYKIYLDVETY